MHFDDIDILTVLACDDVRREDNGKEILIGVYSGGAIGLAAFPSMINPVFWCHFQTRRPGNFAVAFRVANDQGTVFYEVQGQLDIKNPGQPGSVPVNGPPIQAQGDMKLKVEMRLGESDWKTIHEIAVSKLQVL